MLCKNLRAPEPVVGTQARGLEQFKRQVPLKTTNELPRDCLPNFYEIHKVVAHLKKSLERRGKDLALDSHEVSEGKVVRMSE
jgi:hypothetical protein